MLELSCGCVHHGPLPSGKGPGGHIRLVTVCSEESSLLKGQSSMACPPAPHHQALQQGVFLWCRGNCPFQVFQQLGTSCERTLQSLELALQLVFHMEESGPRGMQLISFRFEAPPAPDQVRDRALH